MNQHQIQETIDLLDSSIPREDARVKLHQYGGGPSEGQVIANETGFLRLGIEFLKAAYAMPDSNREPNAVNVDIDYLITEDSSINFDWFERRDLPSAAPTSPVSSIILPLISCSFIAVGLLAVVGFITIVRWLAA